MQKLAYLLRQGRLRRRRRVGAPAVHRPPLGADRASRPTRCRSSLGAQHCHWEEKGAFTGEVSPAMLAKLNVRLRDRRALRAARAVRRDRRDGEPQGARPILKHGMTPILCCGETLEEREAGAHRGEGRRPGARRAGRAVAPSRSAGMVIAYEPIWAIGTGRTASAEDAQAVCALVRATVGRGRRGRRRRGGAHPVRRLGEAVERRRADGPARHRRRARRRGVPRADEFAKIVQYRLARLIWSS